MNSGKAYIMVHDRTGTRLILETPEQAPVAVEVQDHVAEAPAAEAPVEEAPVVEVKAEVVEAVVAPEAVKSPVPEADEHAAADQE
jgi:hypothetical protein